MNLIIFYLNTIVSMTSKVIVFEKKRNIFFKFARLPIFVV